MKNLKKIFLLFMMLITCFEGIAQTANPIGPKCGSDIMMRQDPNYLQKSKDLEKGIQDYIANNASRTQVTNFTIPVVVHVVHNVIDALGNGSNISYAQIQSQIDALNAGFTRDYAQYNLQGHGALAVNTGIKFCLARNTNGGGAWPTTELGVIRYPTNNAALYDQQLTQASAAQLVNFTHQGNPAIFPFANYLNIWVVASICDPTVVGNTCGTPLDHSIMGYGTFPGSAPLDGIVMRADVFGDNSVVGNNFQLFNSGTPYFGLQQGKILVHEAGHYLGLRHTFADMPGTNDVLGCYGTTVGNCATTGDGCCDTPPTNYNGLDCSTIQNACGVNAQLENYMSYSDDACMNTFTGDQRTRLQITLNTTRSNLSSATNLANTGTTPVGLQCSCQHLIANIAFTPLTPCPTTNISFTTPQGAGLSATTWLWNFGDGTPTSNVFNPVHAYAAAGNYTVTLTANNTITATARVTVAVPTATIVAGPALTVCEQTPQLVNLQFTGTPPFSVTFSNGVIVTGILAATSSVIVNVNTGDSPLTLTAMSDAVCAGTRSGQALFNFVACCPSIFNNGNFANGNTLATPATTDLNFVPTGYGNGNYNIYNASTGVSGPWPQRVGLPNRGLNMAYDGYGTGPNTVPMEYTRVWCQNVNIQANTNYDIQFFTTDNVQAGFGQLEFQVRLRDAANNISFIGSPINIPPSASNGTNWHHCSVSFTSPVVLINEEVCICQVNNHDGGAYDIILDDISMRPNIPQTVNAGPNVSICIGETITIGSPPVAGLVYQWTPATGLSNPNIANPVASPNGTTIYTLVVNNPATGCQSRDEVTVTVRANCCTGAWNAPTTINTNTTIASPAFANASINQNLTISAGTLTFNNINVLMGSNVRITVLNGARLVITNFAHLFACSQLWDGIYVEAGGEVTINGNSIIEDARNAIVSNGGGRFIVNTAIFNKDVIGIKVNAFANVHTGTVVNSIFTSRVLGTAPTVAFLKGAGSPTPAMVLNMKTKTNILGNYQDAMNNPLKRMHIGIEVNNVGSASVDLGAVLTSNGGISIGDLVNAGNTNLFDNANFGIYANSSNITVKNNQFQYITSSTSAESCFPNPCSNPYGFGVFGTTPPSVGGGNTAWIGGSAVYPCGPPVDKNIFYECGTAINLTDYCRVDIYSNQISNTTNLSSGGSATPGVGGGIISSSKKNASTSILYNKFTNVNNGVRVNRNWYSLQAGNNFLAQQILGPLTISHNTFIGNVQSTDIIGTGISVYDVIKPVCPTCISTENQFMARVDISRNTLQAVTNGIYITNLYQNTWAYQTPTLFCNVSYNAIVFKSNVGTGINLNLSGSVDVNYNNINGPTTVTYLNKTAWRGVFEKSCTGYKVQCNNIYRVGRCIVLESPSTGPIIVRGNTLNYSHDGLVFRIGARTGTQGNSGFSNANTWGPTANFTRSQTFVEGSPTNLTSPLDVYWVKTGNQQPTLNLFTSPNTAGLAPQITAGTSYVCSGVSFEPCPPAGGGGIIIMDQEDTEIAASAQVSGTAIYPNPFTSEFTTVYDGEGAVTVTVMDLLGKIVVTQQGNAKEEIRISMNDLPSGLYLVKIAAEGNTVMMKTIKQ